MAAPATIYNANMHIPEGTVVDKRFRIGAPLGSGATGAVYEARQLDLERDVAIKFLNENAMLAPEDIARFHREAQILSTLNHRNIVRVYAFGKWGASYYMVIERVDGTSLESHLKGNVPLAKGVFYDIALQLCDGLTAAHAQDVVHRDIKPSNIIIASNGDVKIIDFGFAKIAGPTSAQFQQLTEAGTAIGTVLYMSPEACNGESVDNRADIYSLGAVLHHCLTGQPPFNGSDYLVVMRQQIMEPVPRLKDAAPDGKFSSALQNLIDNAMAKKRTERYQTIRQMREDLERAKRDEVVILRTMTSPVAALAPQKTNKKAIGIAVITSAIASIGVLFYFAHHPGQPHSVADENKDMMSVLETDRIRILNRLHEQHSPKQEGNLWADLSETHLRMAHISNNPSDKADLEKEAVRCAIEAVKREALADKWTMWERLAPAFQTPPGKSSVDNVLNHILKKANDEISFKPTLSRELFKRTLKFSRMMKPSDMTRAIQSNCMTGILACDKVLNNKSEWQADINDMLPDAMRFDLPDTDAMIHLIATVDMMSLLQIDPKAELQISRKIRDALLAGGDMDKNYHELARAHVLASVGLVRREQLKEARELMTHARKYVYLSPDDRDRKLFKRACREWAMQIPEYDPKAETHT